MITSPYTHHGTPYLHVLDGRMRVKIPEIKGSPLKASEIEQALSRRSGVTQVKANPTTGNVLILFDSTATSHTQILAALNELNYCKNALGAAHRTRKSLTQFLVQTAVEKAIERVIFALL